MKYEDLTLRLRIELQNGYKFIKGQADSQDIHINIRNMEDTLAHSFVHINGVQMKWRTIQLGMQEPSDDAYLLMCGFGDEKSIRIRDIDEIYFNHKGWETIHG